MSISKLKIKLAHMIKRESLARTKKRVNRELRSFNITGIKNNWMHQASMKL